MKTITTNNIHHDAKHLRRLVLRVSTLRKLARASLFLALGLLVSVLGSTSIVVTRAQANAEGTTKPLAKSVITPVVADFPQNLARQHFINATFKDVKASHVFVCEDVREGDLPSWLEPEALVAETLKYISEDRDPIEYADHQQHRPDVRECKYDPVLDEPGNLNFIIKLVLSRMPVNGRQIPFFTISRFIYRPDHRTSIQGFLQSESLIVPLTDEQKAKEIEESHIRFWNIGFSDEAAFNK